jgi:hypothetical protein
MELLLSEALKVVGNQLISVTRSHDKVLPVARAFFPRVCSLYRLRHDGSVFALVAGNDVSTRGRTVTS